ncbi:unnamed protein product [Rangifer tarandus platyrhynchus]|uniref:Uncharacterized protein n=1 Tax=Rangifer tarandus platyrhynchus TaxID=3082113 RepID=A0AC59YJM7_RANTA
MQLAAGRRLRVMPAPPAPPPPGPRPGPPSPRGAAAERARVGPPSSFSPLAAALQAPPLGGHATPPSARNQSEPGPAPRFAPTPKSGPAGFPPPGRHPAPATLRPSPAPSLALPRALKGPFRVMTWGLCQRGVPGRRPTGEGHSSWVCLRNNCPSSQSVVIRADPQLCRRS